VEGRISVVVVAARHKLALGEGVAAALEVLGVVAVTRGPSLRMQAEALAQVEAGGAVTCLLDQCFRNGCGVMVCRSIIFLIYFCAFSLLYCTGRRLSVTILMLLLLLYFPILHIFFFTLYPLSFFHLSPSRAFTMALVDFLTFFFFGQSCGYGRGYIGCGSCFSCIIPVLSGGGG